MVCSCFFVFYCCLLCVPTTISFHCCVLHDVWHTYGMIKHNILPRKIILLYTICHILTFIWHRICFPSRDRQASTPHFCFRLRVHEWGCWQTAFRGGVHHHHPWHWCTHGRSARLLRRRQRGSGGSWGIEPHVSLSSPRSVSLFLATAQADAFSTTGVLLFKVYHYFTFPPTCLLFPWCNITTLLLVLQVLYRRKCLTPYEFYRCLII